jgi:hypothetical protein
MKMPQVLFIALIVVTFTVIFYETKSRETTVEMLKRGRATCLLNCKYIDHGYLKTINIQDPVATPPQDQGP